MSYSQASYPPEMGMSSNASREQASWNPYDSNGGTCLALAGENYCIIASTTRLSTGLTVLSRNAPCVTQLSDRSFVISTGFQADIKAVHKLLQVRSATYQHQHHKPMSCEAMSQLISNTLYYRRFFPYYTSTLCAGLDQSGKGAVYSYDVVGSKQRVDHSCSGTGESLVQPVLDSQLQKTNLLIHPQPGEVVHMNLEDALDLVKDAFVAAGERDIYTGDSVVIHIMTQEGVKTETLELKKD